MRRRMTAAQQEAVEALKGYNDPFGDELTPYEQRALEQVAIYADSRLADGPTPVKLPTRALMHP